MSYPFGPTPMLEPDGLAAQQYRTQEKWLIGGLLGAFGGGIAYLIYKKKFGLAKPNANHNQQRAPAKQPTRNVDMQFSCIRDLPPEVGEMTLL